MTFHVEKLLVCQKRLTSPINSFARQLGLGQCRFLFVVLLLRATPLARHCGRSIAATVSRDDL